MNLANMIEEGKLKKTFIIATLVSTLVGTVTASIGLHDKYQEKKEKARQKGVDNKQDDEIKQLREQVEKLKASEDDDSKSSRSSSRSRRRRRRRDSLDDEDDRFALESRRSRALIERMYEDHVARIGPEYARGDLVTENRLQAQIIQLQQTVIGVLQSALQDGRDLSRSDMQRLVAAQNAARNGSLNALEDQYVRMLEGSRNRDRRPWEQAPREKVLLLQDSYAPPRRQLTFPSALKDESPAEPTLQIQRAKTLPMAAAPRRSLFCRYSEYLQASPRKPLSTAFEPEHSSRCPACDVAIAVDTLDTWVLTKSSSTVSRVDGDGSRRKADYRIGARFVVKCHTEDGRFACVLCSRFRDVDCICSSVQALVKHVSSRHGAGEYDMDPDLDADDRAS